MNPPLPPGAQPAPSFLAAIGTALRTSLDVIVAPRRAYAGIKARSTWIVPYLLILIVDFATSALIEPAAAHVEALVAKGTPGALAPSGFVEIQILFMNMILPLVLWWPALAIAFLLLVPRPDDSRGRPEPRPSFSTLFALCVYGSLPQAVGNLVDAVAIRVRDPASFTSGAGLDTAFPLTLAALMPGATQNEQVFLAGVDVFLIWSLLVTAYGFVAIAKVRPLVALGATFAVAAAELVLNALALG